MFTDNDDDVVGPKNINKCFHNRVKKVCWKHPEFKALNNQTGPDEKGLGTHSNRKWASNRAKRKGASKPQVELRGRWIGDINNSIVTRHYISPEDFYSDALVASYLCEAGPIKYILQEQARAVTGLWLYQTVVPNLLTRFARDHCFMKVMAMAKLWAVFDDDACEELPLEEVGRIREAYNQAYGAPEGNPVAKVRLEVLNVDGNLQVVPAVNTNLNNNNVDGQQQEQQQPQQRQGNTNNGQVMALSQHQHQEVLQRLDMIQADQQAMRAWMQQMFDRVITNQRRYGGTVHSAFARSNRQEQQRRDLQQQRAAVDAAAAEANDSVARPPRATGPGAGPSATARPARRVGDREARLVPRPRCLYELWQEYQFGIGNNKPAKNFTTTERNNRDDGLKQKYHYRNKVWKIQSYMLNAGWTVEGMNAELTRVYNSSHVTTIIKGITADSKNQANPMVASVGFRINHRLFAGVTR